jgi:hypothetical protein
MNIQDLNDQANEVVVARLTINQAQARIDEIVFSNPEVSELQAEIDAAKLQKEKAQTKLIEMMSQNALKSWKTEQANFARTVKRSVSIDPNYKRDVEARLKSGESVEGFTLREAEYISVKLAK